MNGESDVSNDLQTDLAALIRVTELERPPLSREPSLPTPSERLSAGDSAARLLTAARMIGEQSADAVVIVQAIVDETPDNLPATRLLAQALRRTGQPYRAAEVLQDATSRFSRTAEVWMALGVIREDLGQRELAIDAYLHAADIDEHCAASCQALARLYFDKQRLSATLRAAREARKRAPDSVEVLTELADYLEQIARMTRHRRRLRDTRALMSEAAECLEAAVRKSNDAALHIRVGSLRYRLGQFEQAEAGFETAVTAKPDSAETLAHLAPGLFLPF